MAHYYNTDIRTKQVHDPKLSSQKLPPLELWQSDNSIRIHTQLLYFCPLFLLRMFDNIGVLYLHQNAPLRKLFQAGEHSPKMEMIEKVGDLSGYGNFLLY